MPIACPEHDAEPDPIFPEQRQVARIKPAADTARHKGAHQELDLRIARSGVGITTAQVEAALGDIWNRPLKPVKKPTRDYAATGPGTLAGGVLRMFWQPVYISGDLKRGWAATVRVLSEEITLFLGEYLNKGASPPCSDIP